MVRSAMHGRHAHGVDIDKARGLAYQVIKHSGLEWKPDRSGVKKAPKTDEESGLLVVYDLKDPKNPKVLAGYVLGHAAEEVAVNDKNGKACEASSGNHPLDGNRDTWVSSNERSMT
jgi:hypothetical protein